MPRSRRDTLIFATILLAPMAVATAYIATTPISEPVVLIHEVLVPVPAPTPVEPALLAADEPADEPAADITAEPVHEPESVRPAGAGMLVYEGQVALSTAPDVAWAHGKLRHTPLEYGTAVSRAVDPTRLPDDLRALADARVVLYSPDGSTCTAQAAPDLLRVYGRQDGELFFAEPEEVTDPATLLAAHERVFADAQLLLARLRPATTQTPRRARCDGLWARRADLPPPAVFVAQPVAPQLRSDVLAALADLPAVQAVAAEYATYRSERAQYTGETPAWSTYVANTLEATRWDEIGGARSFVNVVVGDGGMACSDEFTGRTAVLFTLVAGELVPHADPGFVRPLALMDLERDGHLEAVTADGGALESRGPLGPLQRFEIPYHGCPC